MSPPKASAPRTQRARLIITRFSERRQQDDSYLIE
jgi:hypothetical protein